MNLSLKRILFYVLGLSTLGGTPVALLLYHQNSNSPTSPLTLPLGATEAEAEQERVDSLEGDLWDEVFRTSDLDGEKGTQPRKRYQQENKANPVQKPAPKGGIRVGCICMDENRQERKGRGACSGHGGVRFWLYKMPDGAILKHPTTRHEDHPEALTAAELEQVESHHPNPKKNPYQSPDPSEMESDKPQKLAEPTQRAKSKKNEAVDDDENIPSESASRSDQQQKRTSEQIGHLGFFDLIVIVIICITIAFITHTLFVRK